MSDKEKQEFLNGDSENRTEEQESEDSSDEEPPIGLLDRPIEILYTKREKRIIERFDPRKPPKDGSAKEAEVKIPSGSGVPLSEHPRAAKNLSQETNSDLKVVFSVLFGHKRVKLMSVKKSIRKWNGWEVTKDSTEHHKLEENAANLTMKNLLWVMETLDIEIDGKKSKENLMEILSAWCLKPEPRKLRQKKSEKTTEKTEKSKKSSKKKDKDETKPKRPLSAYFIWMSEHRSSIVEELGSKDVKDVTRAAGEKWGKVSAEDKKKYEGQAKILKEKYEKEMAVWNAANKDSAKPESKSKIKQTKRDSESADSTPKKKVKKKVTMPNEKDLTKCVKKILDGADLETITMKQVVQKVFDKYPLVDLMPKKKFIKAKVKEIIA